MKKILLSAATALILLGCNTPHGSLSTLITDVEAYNRDMVFQRYDVAAKKIDASVRHEWLAAMRSQGIRFSEIEVTDTSPCTPSDDQCYIVNAQVQWYSGNSPSIHNAILSTTWEFNITEKAWRIVKQVQE